MNQFYDAFFESGSINPLLLDRNEQREHSAKHTFIFRRGKKVKVLG